MSTPCSPQVGGGDFHHDFYTFGENQTWYINANAHTHKPAVSTERPSVPRPKPGSNWVISTTEILKMKYVCSEYEQGELTILFKTTICFFLLWQ